MNLKTLFATAGFLCIVSLGIVSSLWYDTKGDPDQEQATHDSVTALGREHRGDGAPKRKTSDWHSPYRELCEYAGKDKEICR